MRLWVGGLGKRLEASILFNISEIVRKPDRLFIRYYGSVVVVLCGSNTGAFGDRTKDYLFAVPLMGLEG